MVTRLTRYNYYTYYKYYMYHVNSYIINIVILCVEDRAP
jgi:hypothetical protein